MSIQYLGSYVPLEPEVMMGMLDLAEIKPGNKFMDLGCGDGQFLKEAEKRGAIACGVELNPALVAEVSLQGLDITEGDVFDADVSKMDIVTFWFTDEVGTPLLMDKLYKEMKNKSRLVMLHSSLVQWRNGVFIPEEDGIIPHIWQPSKTRTVDSNRFHLYIR